MQRVNLSVAIVCMVNKKSCTSSSSNAEIERNKSIIFMPDNSKLLFDNQSFVSYHGNQNSTTCSVSKFIDILWLINYIVNDFMFVGRKF